MNKEQLAEDMQYLRRIFLWSNQEVTEIREVAKEDASWWTWWQRLADAYRNGYSPSAYNNFERMNAWEARQT